MNGNKITFLDKKDSFIYNKNNINILTADNINEIKNVINGLSSAVENAVKFSDIFKYFNFKVPKNLNKGSIYSIKLELSDTNNFLNPIEIDGSFNLKNDFTNLNKPDDFHNFYIFKDNTWKNVGNIVFTSKDEDTSILIDISKVIETDKKYFGRIKLINLTNNDPEYLKNYIWQRILFDT